MSTPAPQFDVRNLPPNALQSATDEEFLSILQGLVQAQSDMRRELQILYYKPASENCRKVHQTTTERYIGVGGGNGCLPLHAPVLMADGSWRPLGEICEGDMVMAADPNTGETRPAPVTTVWRSGRKPVYRVTFSDGGSFEATVEHKVPMYLGSGRKTTKGNPKQPIKRVLGDYIEPIMRRGAKNPSKRISCVSPADIQAAGECNIAISPYLLGALLGDGSLGKTIKFHNVDADVLARVRAAVEAVGGRLSQYDAVDYGVLSDVVRFEMNRLGLRRCNSFTKFIPEETFAWPRAERMELLAGLVDTDGTTDWYVSASERLARGVARLVHSLGGKATVHRRVARCQNGASTEVWAVYHRLNERIPLSLPRKQAVNQRGKEIDYRRRVCREAELVGTFECGDIEVDHPAHCYITGDNVIVSNSSKTETCLVEIIACCTGVIPYDVPELRNHFRGPINCRIVVESITTTLHNIIIPKLQWFKWTGVSAPGGDKGHWGWIPKLCLRNADWDLSWSEKTRTLTVLCRDPDNFDKVLGESSIQFMSHEQDSSDFASGDYHIVLHDEPTRHAIWVENQARTMRVDGRCMLAMTWPDDPAIPVDWIFDELYEPGSPGPQKKLTHAWIELDTRQNRNLDQTAVARQAENWSSTIANTRLGGKPIRFSNRIHPLFTDTTQYWSFEAGKQVEPVLNEDGDPVCPETRAPVVEYCHVREIVPSRHYPTVFLLDPHPRKPHMFLWAQINGNDDIDIIEDGELDGTPDEVWRYVQDIESTYGLFVSRRMMDPNMGRSPSSASRRERTWQEEFADAGLVMDLSDDSDVGRGLVNEFLQPDRYTGQPRLHIAERCLRTIIQMKRYTWDDHKRGLEKDVKQVPKAKNDDYPTLLKYLMNERLTFADLKLGPRRLRIGGGDGRRGYY